MIEKWVNMASQRYENEVDSDDLLPPWVPPIRPVQRTASQRLESPTIKDEKGFSDDNSECSLPSIGEQTTQTEIALYTEDYSIQSNDKSLSLSSGPDDELEAYRESCSVTEDSYHPAAPEIYKTFHNKNNDDNSQASIQFDSQATVQYDSQVTIQYDAQSDNSQETVQYDLREPILHDRQLSDSRDLESHDFNTDSQPSTYNHSQDEVNTPEPYTHNDNQVNIETASLTNSSPYENAEDHTSKSSSPNIFLSPVNDNEFLQYFSPPHVPSTLQQDNFFESLSSPIIETKSIESGGSTTRKHSLQYTSDTESSSPTKSATKSQKLNKVEKKEKGKCKESSSSIRLAQSQEAIKLIRPEKRQLRSSTLKAPKTIETYFSNSLGTSQEGESGKAMALLRLS